MGEKGTEATGFSQGRLERKRLERKRMVVGFTVNREKGWILPTTAQESMKLG